MAIGLVIIAVVGMVQWRRVRIGEAESSLKIRMIERGYSPNQIAQVLQTKVGTAHGNESGPQSEKRPNRLYIRLANRVIAWHYHSELMIQPA